MVPDRQKVRTDGHAEWTDGMDGRTDGRTHGQRQNYIPLTSSGDDKKIECKIVNNILPISSEICFGCLKEMSH